MLVDKGYEVCHRIRDMQCVQAQWAYSVSGDEANAVCHGSMGMQYVRG